MNKYEGPYPMNEGKTAGMYGKSLADNPYPRDSRYADRWEIGFNAGKAIFDAENLENARLKEELKQRNTLDYPWNDSKRKILESANFDEDQKEILIDILDNIKDYIDDGR